MDKIEKIKEWVQKQMEFYWEKLPDADDEHPTEIQLRDLGQYMAYENMESFLDTLSEEPDKGLDVTDFCKPIDPGIAQCVADHWWEMLDGKEPDKDLEEEVKRYYSDNFAYISSDQPTLSILTNIARHFSQWKAEQMMKDAVVYVAEPETPIGNILIPFVRIDHSVLFRYGIKVGDKVKLIILGGNKFKPGDRIIYHGNGYEITGVDDKWYKVKADIPSQIPELEINAISKDNEKDIKRQE